MKKVRTIAAPKEKVWSVLLEEEYNRLWLAEFGEGSHAETDWIVGHKVRFTGDSGGGIVGRIEEKQPYDIIHIVYEGLIGKDGAEDYDSTEALKWAGTQEIYRLEDSQGKTMLHIECDVDEAMSATMDASWDKALDRIEELSQAV